ncbi:hypothetical protein BgiMline_012825, partial [Biomphalaria glabrata]
NVPFPVPANILGPGCLEEEKSTLTDLRALFAACDSVEASICPGNEIKGPASSSRNQD